MLSRFRVVSRSWHANRHRYLSTSNSEQCERFRIAICGSGVVGPTLAGVLSRRLGEMTQADNIHLSIDMFERAPPDSDQGYGLDLDEFGQEALVQAGVYHRFWEIARPVSETSAIYSLCGAQIFVATKPEFQPECNRGGLRQLMIDAANANAKRFGKPTEMPSWDGCTNRFNMHFDTKIQDMKSVTSSESDIDTIELMGSRGKGPQESLGEFDLVVDCMGWSSTLRKYRMSDYGNKAKYDGTVMVHGSLPNPMESVDEDVKSVFGADNGRGYGTVVVVGGGHKTFVFQQYGAGADDKRHAFFSYFDRPGDPDAIFEEIGVPKPNSRNTGIMQGENLAKTKAWLHAQLGDHGTGSNFYQDPPHDGNFPIGRVWKAAIDELDRVTVRPQYSLVDPQDTVELLPDEEVSRLPLVCIGDSINAAGLGGGGIIGMRDALELTDTLCESIVAQKRIDLDRMLRGIRQLEPSLLDRKEEFRRMKGGSQVIRIPALRKGHVRSDLHHYLLTRMLSHDDTKHGLSPTRKGKEMTRIEMFTAKAIGVMVSPNNTSTPNPNHSLLYQHVWAPLLARVGSLLAVKFCGLQHGKYKRTLKESGGLKPGSRPEGWRDDVSEHVRKAIATYGCEGWDVEGEGEDKGGGES